MNGKNSPLSRHRISTRVVQSSSAVEIKSTDSELSLSTPSSPFSPSPSAFESKHNFLSPNFIVNHGDTLINEELNHSDPKNQINIDNIVENNVAVSNDDIHNSIIEDNTNIIIKEETEEIRANEYQKTNKEEKQEEEEEKKSGNETRSKSELPKRNNNNNNENPVKKSFFTLRNNTFSKFFEDEEMKGEIFNSSLDLRDPETITKSTTGSKIECFEWGRGFKIFEKSRILRGKTVVQVSAMGSHSCALLDDGSVYTWGNGRNGQLGHGEEMKSCATPTKVESLVQYSIQRIWTGLVQTCAMTSCGKLFIFGLLHQHYFLPHHVNQFDSTTVLDVCFSLTSIGVCALIPLSSRLAKQRVGFIKTEIADVFVWGSSKNGRLTNGIANLDEPQIVTSLIGKNIVSLGGGETHMAAVSLTGQVYIWGSLSLSGANKESVGRENGEVIETATKVMGLEAQVVVKVMCGSNYTYALTKNGEMFSWGCGANGMLGHGNEEDYEFPGRINSLCGKKIVGMASGGSHSCVWSSEGRIYSWGCGRGFRLGHKTEEDKYTPTLIEALSSGHTIMGVSCSNSSTLALVEKDFLSVTYNGNSISLPAFHYPIVSSLIEKIASHYSLKPADVILVDESGSEILPDLEYRELKENNKTAVQVLTKPSLMDLHCDTFLLTKEEENITVRGGTIDKLIEWLTFPDSIGLEFTITFMITYQTFMTSEELLEKLIERYHSAFVHENSLCKYSLTSYQVQSYSDSQNIIKIRVLNIVKKWLSNHTDNFIGRDASPLFHTMKSFIEIDPISQFPRESSHIIRLINNQLNIDNNIADDDDDDDDKYPHIDIFADSPPPSKPYHNEPFDLFKYPPLEIARQLTVIDFYFYFRKIQPSELIGQAWSKKNKGDFAPNVLKMIHRFNNVSDWVTKLTLTGKTQSTRTKILERFIDIAFECFKLNNLNMVMAILSSFERTSLHRLKTLWDVKLGGISLASAEKLSKLKSVFAVGKNMASYRKFFKGLTPPKIPFLGMYLQDLTFIDDGNPDYLDQEKKIINYDKRIRLSNIISVIIHLQKDPYKLTALPELIDSLHLPAKGFDNNHASISYDLSKYIEQTSGVLNRDDISDVEIADVVVYSPNLPIFSPAVTRKQ